MAAASLQNLPQLRRQITFPLPHALRRKGCLKKNHTLHVATSLDSGTLVVCAGTFSIHPGVCCVQGQPHGGSIANANANPNYEV
jgi:hypothetical protein